MGYCYSICWNLSTSHYLQPPHKFPFWMQLPHKCSQNNWSNMEPLFHFSLIFMLSFGLSRRFLISNSWVYCSETEGLEISLFCIFLRKSRFWPSLSGFKKKFAVLCPTQLYIKEPLKLFLINTQNKKAKEN